MNHPSLSIHITYLIRYVLLMRIQSDLIAGRIQTCTDLELYWLPGSC